MRIKFVILLFLIFAIPLTSSLNEIAKQGESYDIRLTIAANGSIDSVTSNITVNDPNGIVLVSYKEMQKNLDSQDFNYTISGSNTSKLGRYGCVIYAYSTIADNKIISCDFEVNPSGKDYIPEISGPLLLGAVLTLIFISLFLFLLAFKIDLFPMKVFLLIMSGLIAIANIGFIAGSFNEFLSVSSSLTGVFGTLYIIFITLITGASIFLFIWLIVIAAKLYQAKRGFIE